MPGWSFVLAGFRDVVLTPATGLPAFAKCKGMSKACSTSGFVTNGRRARSEPKRNEMNGREQLTMLF
jgi:hypothetical protein